MRMIYLIKATLKKFPIVKTLEEKNFFFDNNFLKVVKLFNYLNKDINKYKVDSELFTGQKSPFFKCKFLPSGRFMGNIIFRSSKSTYILRNVERLVLFETLFI